MPWHFWPNYYPEPAGLKMELHLSLLQRVLDSREVEAYSYSTVKLHPAALLSALVQ
jgi:hypothetical protein